MSRTWRPYVQIGADPTCLGGTGLRGSAHPGLDCSGLEYAICLALGQPIARTSESQFATLPVVEQANLRQGDEVFYGQWRPTTSLSPAQLRALVVTH